MHLYILHVRITYWKEQYGHDGDLVIPYAFWQSYFYAGALTEAATPIRRFWWFTSQYYLSGFRNLHFSARAEIHELKKCRFANLIPRPLHCGDEQRTKSRDAILETGGLSVHILMATDRLGVNVEEASKGQYGVSMCRVSYQRFSASSQFCFN